MGLLPFFCISVVCKYNILHTTGGVNIPAGGMDMGMGMKGMWYMCVYAGVIDHK